MCCSYTPRVSYIGTPAFFLPFFHRETTFVAYLFASLEIKAHQKKGSALEAFPTRGANSYKGMSGFLYET